MSEAFTVFWDRNSCRELRKAGEEGQPLTVLFGGIHQSCPSLKRAHISHGDVVFPIMVHRGELHVLARAVIKEFISLQSYLSEHLKLPPAEIDGLPEYRVGEVLTRFGITGHRVPHAAALRWHWWNIPHRSGLMWLFRRRVWKRSRSARERVRRSGCSTSRTES